MAICPPFEAKTKYSKRDYIAIPVLNRSGQIIDVYSEDGFYCIKMSGLALQPYEIYAKNIADYLAEEDTSEIVGDGMLTIDRTGLTYDGTKNGEKFLFHIDSLSLPTYGMCTDVSKFYTFYKGVFVEFYPDYPCVEKFFLVTEEMHRLNGGRWQDFKFYK